jgi:hypothetical protein
VVLAPPLTLLLLEGDRVRFSSERHWLHPLFDLAEALGSGQVRGEGCRLVDRVTGRAAAFLVARMGLRELETRVLSRKAMPVLEAHGVACRYGELVDRIPCATEDLLEDVLDPEVAWNVLQARLMRCS